MRVLVVEHQDDAGLGVFGPVLEASAHEVVVWRPDKGEAPRGALDAAVVLGGAAHPHEVERFPWLEAEKRLIRALLEQDAPMLGICLGAELVAEGTGASIERLGAPEIGWFEITASPRAHEDPVFGALPDTFTAFQWHSYAAAAPRGAVELAPGAAGPNAFRLGNSWGVQFHPEVTAEIVDAWLADHQADRDALAVGFDPAPVRQRTSAEIDASGRMGATLVGAFLDYAATVGGRKPMGPSITDPG